MTYKNLFSTALISSMLLVTSCENDINLTAPYREIGVIYGIISPVNTIHVVRIQKAFLGEGNANEMAQVVDSTYYPDILDVQLQRIKDDEVIGSFPLTRFIGSDKEPGFFPVSPNVLYKSDSQVLFRDSEYRIVVKNTQTGNEFYATTPLVDSLRITKPSRAPSAKIQFSNPQFPYRVEFQSAYNGKIVNMTIRFHYTEEINGSGVVEAKYIDWPYASREIENPDVQEDITIEIVGEDFYKYVGQTIPVNPNAIRNIGFLDFFFETGAEVLANYVEINQANTSISTTTPYYSNVVNGTGIFSSNYFQEIIEKELDDPSKSLLKTSEYTSDLGFQ